MNPKSTNIATSLLASLGIAAAKSFAEAFSPALGLPAVVEIHTSKVRNRQRKLCRGVGPRQYRRLTRKAYALKAGALSA